MNSSQGIAKNMISLFIGGFATSVSTVILSIFIARFLGDVIFGKFSFVIAFVALFSFFIDLGYETLLIRDVAKDNLQADRYVNNILIIRLILSVVIFVVIFLLALILNFEENIKILLYLFTFSQILTSLSNIFRVTFRAFKQMKYEAGVNILVNTSRCFLGVVLLYFGFNIIVIALVFLYTAILDFFMTYFICEKNFVKITTQFNFTFFRSTLKIAVALSTLAIFSVIFVRISIIMLGFMKGDAVVGWYNAAYNLIYGFSPIPLLFMNTLLPYMAYSSTKSKESLKELYEKSFKLLFLFALPITAGIFLLADKFIVLFYGSDFINSIPALKLLSFCILLKFLYLCVFFVLVSIDKQSKLAIICGGGALLNIILNLFLIPQYSLMGSAIALNITFIFILLMYLYLAFKNDLTIPIQKIIIKPIIACTGMVLFIYTFSELNLYLLISFSILIYFGIFFLIKGFSTEEISLLKSIMARKR